MYVPGAKPPQEYVFVLAPTFLDVTALVMVKPCSSAEVSVQSRRIVLELTAVAVRPVGAAGPTPFWLVVQTQSMAAAGKYSESPDALYARTLKHVWVAGGMPSQSRVVVLAPTFLEVTALVMVKPCSSAELSDHRRRIVPALIGVAVRFFGAAGTAVAPPGFGFVARALGTGFDAPGLAGDSVATGFSGVPVEPATGSSGRL